MSYYLEITPHDPFIARDGRPFNAGQHRMRSLAWPYPTVLAGSLRTLLGKLGEEGFDDDTVKALKQTAVAGPFPSRNRKAELYLPAPLDFVLRGEPDRRAFALRPEPLANGERVNLPDGFDQPPMLPGDLAKDFKPARPPAFWSAANLAAWLANPTGRDFKPPPPGPPDPPGYIQSIEQDERMHVAIDPASTTAKDEMLFKTAGLALPAGFHLAARAEPANGLSQRLEKLDTLHPLGGERRLAHWKSRKKGGAWQCPARLRSALRGGKGTRVRMVLATPALFANAWKPGWLDTGPPGKVPGADVRLQLVSACLGRWQAISGWSLERGSFGPKPVRRLAPAGSVYFFEVIEGDAAALADAWLRPVSDEEQDRLDGFGLAAWGVWKPHSTESR